MACPSHSLTFFLPCSVPSLHHNSSDLWVYETGTGADNPEWDASASSTAVTDPVIPWSIQYGKGEQEGFLNQDSVELGGYSTETVFASANTLNAVSGSAEEEDRGGS